MVLNLENMQANLGTKYNEMKHKKKKKLTTLPNSTAIVRLQQSFVQELVTSYLLHYLHDVISLKYFVQLGQHCAIKEFKNTFYLREITAMSSPAQFSFIVLLSAIICGHK